MKQIDRLKYLYNHAILGQEDTEAIEFAIECAEKTEPRCVRYEGDGYADGEIVYDYAYCPNCDHETEVDSENWGSLFCPECGQALKWGNE